MLKKITSSLAYRLPKIYSYLLRLKPIKLGRKKEFSDQIILSMTGKNHINMTRLSLFSIGKTWETLPRVIITSDGTMSAEEITERLSFWPGELTVLSWQETASYHNRLHRKALVNYGEAHPFGKKLAIILHHAATQPVLWVDSDILFFNDFTPYLPKSIKGFACGGTEDIIGAYDNAVLNFFNNDLYKQYNFNAGLLFASGDSIYEDFNLEELLATIHPDYDFLTEQSIFAHVATGSLELIWSKDLVKCFHHDNQLLAPMDIENVIARHYVSTVRHLFWRDAFYQL